MEKYEPYTLEELKNLILENKHLEISYKEFEDYIVLESIINCEFIDIQHCNFKKGLNIVGLDLKQGFLCFECKFLQLEINSCYSSFENKNSFRISNSKIEILNFVDNYDFFKSLIIHDTDIFDFCSISSFKSFNTKVELSECRIEGCFSAKNNELEKIFFTNKTIIKGTIEFLENNKFKEFYFLDSNFQNEVKIYGIDVDSFIFFSCIFDGVVSLINNNINGFFDIENSIFNQKINIKNYSFILSKRKIYNINVKDNTYVDGFNLDCTYYINDFRIFFSKNHKGVINVNASFCNIHLVGTNTELEINFNRTCTNNLYLKNFKNSKEIKFVDLKVLSSE